MLFQYLFLIVAVINPGDEPVDSHANEEYFPSSLIEGKVSVVTGKVYSYNEDYVIAGQEPIRINRVFHEEKWTLLPHLLATHYKSGDRCEITESNGISYEYKKSSQFKVGKEYWSRYEFYHSSKRGRNNAGNGRISGRMNHKNSYVILDPKEKFLDYYAPDGTVRHFKKNHHEEDSYRLLSEKLPNGNQIFYEYSENVAKKKKHHTGIRIGRLLRIRTTDPSGKITYATADFLYSDSDIPTAVMGSDSRTLRYQKFDLIESPDQPEVRLTNQNGLSRIDLPMNRYQGFSFYDQKPEVVMGQKVELEDISYEYDVYHGEERDTYTGFIPDVRRNRVKTIYAPAGSDASPINTSSLIYFPGDQRTLVYDADRNCTTYCWDNDGLLTNIEKTSSDGKRCNREKFTWGQKGWLVCTSFSDENDSPLSIRRFHYDSFGNVTLEQFFGDISGHGPRPILNEEQRNVANLCEGYAKSYSYDAHHLLICEREDNGKVTHTQYLPGTDLVTAQFVAVGDQIKIRKFFEYNNQNILIRKIIDDGISSDKNNLTAVHTRTICVITPKPEAPYLGMPWIIEEKYWNGKSEALLKKTVFTYSDGARIAQKDVYDADGVFRYSLKFTYDNKGRLLTQTNALGQVESFVYDACGNQIRTVKERLATEITYDFSDRPILVRKSGDDGIVHERTFAYNERHQLIQETDPRGVATTHTYDALGRCIATQFPKIAAEQGVLLPEIRSRFDATGNEVEKVDAEGNRILTRYNAYGKPTLITYPDGTSEESIYNMDGTLKTHVDQSGVTESYFYDGLQNLVKKTTSSSEEVFSWHGNKLMSKTDAEGNCTIYAYDGAGRKISESFDGVLTTWSYDALGRVATIQKGPLATHFEYDLLDRLVEERKCDGATGEVLRLRRMTYDAMGNSKEKIAFVAGQEVREESRYDSMNRLIRKKDYSGAVETTSFEDFYSNTLGQKVLRKTHTDPLGLQTIEIFDPQNRVVFLEKRKERTLSLEEKIYNRNGFCTLQTNTVYDADGSSRSFLTRWAYDSRNRITMLTESDSKITRYSYTARGELTQTIKPDGTTLSYKYNDFGHRTGIFSSDGSVSHHRILNRLGHLMQHDGVRREVDARGNLLKEVFPQGFTIESSYDALDRKIECSLLNQGSFEWEYNACDLLRAGRIRHGQRLYEHRILARDLSGNVLEESSIQGERFLHSVDACSRKVKVETPRFSQEILELDQVGNIRSMRIQGEERVYEYDELYQLVSESGSFAHNYRYDALNNRLQKDAESYQINNLQQLVSHYEYDRNGNPIQKGATRYFYDALDRLIRLEQPNLIQTYTYDSENRCLSKVTHREGSSETRYFLYDGQNEIGAFDEGLNLRELRVLGTPTHAEIGAALALELNDEVYAPIHDLQGNVAVLMGGDVSYHTYSAFGEEKLEGAKKSPWRFSSKRSDEETGLVYFGRRFYSPEFGRWLTPDPAGFTDGMNLYAFVHNDPLTHFDEYGLFSTILSGGTFLHEERARNVESCLSPIISGIAHEGYAILSDVGREVDNMFQGLDRLFGFTSLATQEWTPERIKKDHESIDRFFGTDFGGPMSLPNIQGVQWSTLEAPMPGRGGSCRSSFAKTAQNAERISEKLTKFKPLTKDHYRHNLKVLTGKNPPKTTHAHYVFPQEYRGRFLEKWNINIDDPRYLTWWPADVHLPKAKAYSAEWKAFFLTKPTAEEVFEQGRKMMNRHGIKVNY